MDNAYYKMLVRIIDMCNNRIETLENRNKAKYFQSKLSKYKLEDTLLFEYPNGSIILLKDELFPQSIIDLVSNYDKLLAASKEGQPTFRITSIHSNPSITGTEKNTQPLVINKAEVQNNILQEHNKQQPLPTQILKTTASAASAKELEIVPGVKDVEKAPNKVESKETPHEVNTTPKQNSTELYSKNSITDIKKKLHNLSEELKKY